MELNAPAILGQHELGFPRHLLAPFFVSRVCWIGSLSISPGAAHGTTIRIPDDLKTRVAKAAGRVGTMPHNFIARGGAESRAGRASG